MFFTTIGGFIISAVNLKEVCKANAPGDNVTFTAFYTGSISQVYKDALSWLIIGALVLATEEHVPVHLKVFLVDTKNFNTKFSVYWYAGMFNETSRFKEYCFCVSK